MFSTTCTVSIVSLLISLGKQSVRYVLSCFFLGCYLAFLHSLT